MKRALTYAGGIIAFAVGLVAATASAQTFSNGPYYATPSWDQTLPASTRFIVLTNFNNEAVLDRETGLVWQRSPMSSTVAGYSNAVQVCASTNIGERQGWRVPHLSEFESLMDNTVTSQPTFPPGHPFTGFPTSGGTVPFLFWTDTSTGAGTGRHFCPGYGRRASDGSVTQINGDCIDNISAERLFCVRGPGNTGP